jgi:beta-glucosidase
LEVNEEIDERTQFELYYPPFEGAIEAGVASIMCSYNKVNGHYSCENNSTLGIDLRERLGFEGWVMSDWGATHSLSIPQGLDQEMGDGKDRLVWKKEELEKVNPDLLDQSVHRILRSMIKVGAYDDKRSGNILSHVSTKKHQILAQ